MEIKHQFISAIDSVTCAEGKQRKRMVELQEKRISLQALLSTRLAELKCICLQEAELTGTVPDDLNLENEEKPLFAQRRSGGYCQGNRKSRAEDEDCQFFRLKKTLFSGTMRKHSDSEHSTHTFTYSQNGKRTVHRGCHTDDTVKSESNSLADSKGNNNEDVFYQNKTRRNSLHKRNNHHKTLPPNKPLPPLLSHHPHLSQDSCSGSSEFGHTAIGTVLVNVINGSKTSDILLDKIDPSKGIIFRGMAPTGMCQRTEDLTIGQAKLYNRPDVGGHRVGEGHRSEHTEVLLDYIWIKQQQMQQSQPGSRQPITSQFYDGFFTQDHAVPLCTLPSHLAEPQHVNVNRTKSCGPFIQGRHKKPKDPNLSQSNLLTDPISKPMPPIPSKLSPNQNAQLEEGTRGLHKALALEGLRDWYLRNTVGSFHQIHNNGNLPFGFTSGLLANVKGCVNGQSGRCTALQKRVATQGVIYHTTYSTEMSGHSTLSHHQQKLPHSATFHGHLLHERSADTLPCQDTLPSQQPDVEFRVSFGEQLSPGTLV